MFFIYQLAYYRRKRINLNFKETEEKVHLKYQYKTEFYKFALLLVIALIEPFIFISSDFVMKIEVQQFNNQTYNGTNIWEHNLIQSTLINAVISARSVAWLATVSLINILIIYMSFVCRSYTEFSLIKKRLQNFTLFIIVLLILSILTTIGAVIAQLIVLFSIIYQYIQLFRNSKRLYNLLKWRNENLFIERFYLLYRKYKKITQRYKWFTIFILIALFGFIIVLWIDVLDTVTSSMLALAPIEHLMDEINKGAYEEARAVFLMVKIIMNSISFGILFVQVIWITVCCITELESNNMSVLCSRKRKKGETTRTSNTLRQYLIIQKS